jgi:hypothetical protein
MQGGGESAENRLTFIVAMTGIPAGAARPVAAGAPFWLSVLRIQAGRREYI